LSVIESATHYYKNGRVLTVERGKPAVLKGIVEYSLETVTALTGFIRTGGTSKLPTRIILPVTKFQAPKFAVLNARNLTNYSYLQMDETR
jgi:hypothetical protein